MHKEDFLLEIATEEIPARFMSRIFSDLENKSKKWLNDLQLNFESIKIYGTPRRICLYIEGLDNKQSDQELLIKGPAKKIAYDSTGELSKAGLGFIKSQGAGLEDLEIRELDGIEYLYIHKSVKGDKTINLLAEIKDIILNLQFPKNMRWNKYDIKFVRPIKWLLCLYGTEIVDFDIINIKSDRFTYGHRFLSTEKIIINNPKEYIDKLRKAYVIVDQEERQNLILSQLKELEKSENIKIKVDEDLLNEINYLVEYPTVFMGAFDKDFLDIPDEVLVTSMKEHQRYFPVFDQENNLKANFIAVRNGDEYSLELVRKGNEKVLRARLSDAKFFYEEDKKESLDSFVEKLDNIIYQKELGTVSDKIKRVEKVAKYLAVQFKLNEHDKDQLKRISYLSKFDLVTLMVNEFPELQGFMGREYANISGEPADVCQAIYEAYLPRFAGDILPESSYGAIMSIAEKIDTIVGCFGIGLIPTGSQDPYALRRQATGICHIIKEHKLDLSLESLISKSIAIFQEKNLLNRDIDEILIEILDFFRLRVKNMLQEEDVRYDLIDASIVKIDNILDNFALAHYLQANIEEEWFIKIIDAYNRVTNISKSAKIIDYDNHTNAEVDKELFVQTIEQDLYNLFKGKEQNIKSSVNKRDFKGAYEDIKTIQPLINQYFDQVMVMDPDEKIKNNRLIYMSKLQNLLSDVADLSKIVSK